MKKWMYILLMSALLLPLCSHAQSLDSLIAIATRNNPGLQGEFAQFEASMQRIAQANALPDPDFSFGYFISPVETRVGPQRARFSLSQMFPWFGSLRDKGDAASLMAEAQYQEFVDAKNELSKNVELAYYPLLETNQLIGLEEEFINLLVSNKELATASFTSGKGKLADAIRADIMIDMAQTRIDILREKSTPLHSILNALLDRPSDELLLMDEDLRIPLGNDVSPVDSAFRDNPRLLALKKREDAQSRLAELATKQGLPSFGIGVDYVLVDERTDMNVPGNGTDVLMPMVRMSIPIWRKKYRAAQDEAILRQASFAFKRQDMENMLESQYDRLAFELFKAREMDELYELQITKSGQLLNLLTISYQNSGADFEEILRTQQDILGYRKSKVKTAREYHSAFSKLNYITAK